MSKGLSTRELARQLGVSPSTLRIWEDVLQLDIPRDEQNHRRYPPELIDTLGEIARLRQAGFDYAHIARELRLNIDEAPEELADEALIPVDLRTPDLASADGAWTADGDAATAEVPADAPLAAEAPTAVAPAPEMPTAEEPIAFVPMAEVAATVAEPMVASETPVEVTASSYTTETTFHAEATVMQTSVLGKDSYDLLQAYTRLSDDHRALSAKYAEATFAIGQLEERVQYLTQQLLDSESKLAKMELAKLEAAEVKALPPPPEPVKVDDTAIRDLEGQVRLLALAVLNSKPMTVWERFTLWWNR